jgi:hypothetical protein
VHPEALRSARALGQLNLGVDVLALAPSGVKALKGGAIFEARLGEAGAQVIECDRLGALWRPLGEGLRQGLGLGREGAGGIAGPLTLLFLGARVDRDLTTALLIRG